MLSPWRIGSSKLTAALLVAYSRLWQAGLSGLPRMGRQDAGKYVGMRVRTWKAQATARVVAYLCRLATHLYC